MRLREAEGGEGEDLVEDGVRDVLGDAARGGAVAEGLPLRPHRRLGAAAAHRPAQRLRLAGAEAGERDGDVEAPGPGRRSRRASRAAALRAAGGRRGSGSPGRRAAPRAARGTGARRRPGSGPGGRAPPRSRGRRGPAAGCAGASASARATRSGTRRRCRPPGSRRRPRRRRAAPARGRCRSPVSAIATTHSSTAESMPSPSRSILRKPASAQESLSHWQIVRPAIAAGCSGTIVDSGRSEMTMPPGCCERWRGRPAMSCASAASARKRRSPARGASPGSCSSSSADGAGVPAVGGLREPGDVGGGQAERLAELADRTAGAVGGEGADERRLPRPVAVVHAQDQLLADVAREVEVDVGHRGELGVEEAAERQPRLDGVDVREARQVADDRADARAAPAPGRQDVPRRAGAAHLERDLAGQLEHLVVQEEEARQAVAADQRELVVEPSRAPPRASARPAGSAPRTGGGRGRRARGPARRSSRAAGSRGRA